MFLLIFRIISGIVFFVLVCIFGSVYCLINLNNPNNASYLGRIFGKMVCLFGIKVEKRIPKSVKKCKNAIYICNHQSNYDFLTASNIIQPYTVTIGKKSLVWLPFFGQLYWLSGNLLIDRSHKKKSYEKILDMLKKLRGGKISIWIFPEGKRNTSSSNLLPFKSGAFYMAIKSEVPLIPVCISRTLIKLRKKDNGLIIIEMLPPIDSKKWKINQFREFSTYCRSLMSSKIRVLDKEVKEKSKLFKR